MSYKRNSRRRQSVGENDWDSDDVSFIGQHETQWRDEGLHDNAHSYGAAKTSPVGTENTDGNVHDEDISDGSLKRKHPAVMGGTQSFAAGHDTTKNNGRNMSNNNSSSFESEEEKLLTSLADLPFDALSSILCMARGSGDGRLGKEDRPFNFIMDLANYNPAMFEIFYSAAASNWRCSKCSKDIFFVVKEEDDESKKDNIKRLASHGVLGPFACKCGAVLCDRHGCTHSIVMCKGCCQVPHLNFTPLDIASIIQHCNGEPNDPEQQQSLANDRGNNEETTLDDSHVEETLSDNNLDVEGTLSDDSDNVEETLSDDSDQETISDNSLGAQEDEENQEMNAGHAIVMIRNVINSGIASICRGRRLFPSSFFQTYVFDFDGSTEITRFNEEAIKRVVDTSSSQAGCHLYSDYEKRLAMEALSLLRWLQSDELFEFLAEGILARVVFCICIPSDDESLDDDKSKDEVQEFYFFNISENLPENPSEIDRDQVCEATASFFQTLEQFSRGSFQYDSRTQTRSQQIMEKLDSLEKENTRGRKIQERYLTLRVDFAKQAAPDKVRAVSAALKQTINTERVPIADTDGATGYITVPLGHIAENELTGICLEIVAGKKGVWLKK